MLVGDTIFTSHLSLKGKMYLLATVLLTGLGAALAAAAGNWGDFYLIIGMGVVTCLLINFKNQLGDQGGQGFWIKIKDPGGIFIRLENNNEKACLQLEQLKENLNLSPEILRAGAGCMNIPARIKIKIYSAQSVFYSIF